MRPLLKVKAKEYEDIVKRCAYVILPSCSEGEPSSVINAMVYGLLPIAPKSAGIKNMDSVIEIYELTVDCIKQSLTQAFNLTDLASKSLNCATDTIVKHSIESYTCALKDALLKIIRILKKFLEWQKRKKSI